MDIKLVNKTINLIYAYNSAKNFAKMPGELKSSFNTNDQLKFYNQILANLNKINLKNIKAQFKEQLLGLVEARLWNVRYAHEGLPVQKISKKNYISNHDWLNRYNRAKHENFANAK